MREDQGLIASAKSKMGRRIKVEKIEKMWQKILERCVLIKLQRVNKITLLIFYALHYRKSRPSRRKQLVAQDLLFVA